MRNNESKFSSVATVDKPRSTFDRDCTVKTCFNVGELVPFYLDEVLPGDTFNVKTNKLVRLSTPITPFMDDLYLDTYYFYVPMRLVWDKTKEFFGENTKGHWYPTTEYQVPQLHSNGGYLGTLWDYFGLPVTGSVRDKFSVSVLPFRAYGLIWNEFFRDENLQDPVLVRLDSTTADFNVNDPTLGGRPLKACKLHDYFTSCLPAPQKGPSVAVPTDPIAVFPQYGFSNYENFDEGGSLTEGWQIPQWKTYNNLGTSLTKDALYTFGARIDNNIIGNTAGDITTRIFSSSGSGGANSTPFIDNLATAPGIAFSINELRNAFQLQRFYELSARGGSRYRETILAHFGVTNPDARVQIPEYLGGNRVNLNVNQVLQNSETSNDSPLGNTGAYSLTTDSNSDFVKSFSEHGFIIGVAVCRYNHSYQNGINRMWSRKNMTDFYFPAFANIGEQPVLNKEICAVGHDDNDNSVFGYQEAWAEYRYKPSYVTSSMRSDHDYTLDYWHFADYYKTCPTLSSGWIEEEKSNVDRCLAVTSDVSEQLIADFYIQNRTTRVMPLYSIPGLIDHN